MYKKITVLMFFLVILITACSPQEPLKTPVPQQSTSQPSPSATLTPTKPALLTLEESAQAVVNALSVRDLETVAEFVHPERGVRLSPYTYVQDDHQVFLPNELPGLAGFAQVLLWGNYDGSGDPIELTFDEYYARFLYSADFANPEAMAVNKELGHSSMINNIADYYPGSSFVEYHFSGFEEEYGGMDWVSLRLVFIQEDGVWFLVGLVNDRWTI